MATPPTEPGSHQEPREAPPGTRGGYPDTRVWPGDPPAGGAPSGFGWPDARRPLHLANWMQRAFAFAVDLMVILAVVLTADALAGAFLPTNDTLILVVGGSVTFVYFLVFGLTGGVSPGKRIFRLRTTSVDGSRPSVVQSILDALSKTVLPLLLVDTIVGLVSARERRQRFVQRAGGLVVIFEPPPAPKRVVFVP